MFHRRTDCQDLDVDVVENPRLGRDGVALALGLAEFHAQARGLCYGGTHAGFVPRARNQELAKMLFFGHGGAFEAYVQSTDWTQHPERQVRMMIYVRDRR